MIQSLLQINIPIVLASQSPRRRKLLEILGLKFSVEPADINEDILPNELPIEHSIRIAKEKGLKIASKYNQKVLIISADTIVVIDDQILSKPKNTNEAFNFLRLLSGRSHFVFTSFFIYETISNKNRIHTEKTEVYFRKLDEAEIRAYISTGSPLDKAGAYGIQDDFGAVFVEKIIGCYYNVIGLPLQSLYLSLKQFYNNKK